MADDRKVTLFHSPNTRSSGALPLLEELGVPYELRVLNMKAGEQRRPEYLAINPMGKVPALKQDDALVTEQVAIFLHLADLFPEHRLAPPLGERWGWLKLKTGNGPRGARRPLLLPPHDSGDAPAQAAVTARPRLGQRPREPGRPEPAGSLRGGRWASESAPRTPFSRHRIARSPRCCAPHRHEKGCRRHSRLAIPP